LSTTDASSTTAHAWLSDLRSVDGLAALTSGGLAPRTVTAVEPPASARRRSAKDVTAGVTLGLVSVPDGLAMGLLAGLNPVAGLYGYLVGTVVGAVATSSVLMSVQATGAMAVLIADVPALRTAEDPARALATLGVLTGAVMLVLGVLRLGSLVRFVPNAVLTGFVNAVAVNIVLGQLPSLTGFDSSRGNRLTRAIDTLLSPFSLDWPTVLVGVATIVLIVALERTRLRALGMLVAVAVTSALADRVGLFEGVLQLRDIADIPASLPRPVLPELRLLPVLLLPAVSLAFVGLVQGAAISQTVPNPDGTFPDTSDDFRGQGIANVASGLLRGMPVGGSMSATAILTAAGARSRLANATAGVVIALAILFLSDLVAVVAMPALAGLLIVVGYRTFNVDQVLQVWQTGQTQATVMATTFVLTLIVPLQYAVLVGVGLSVILYVVGQSNRVRVVRLIFPGSAAYPVESEPPPAILAGETVVLAVHGSLFFASAPVFEQQLPDIDPHAAGGPPVEPAAGVPTPPQPAAPPAPETMLAELERLVELKQQGLLTDDEFAALSTPPVPCCCARTGWEQGSAGRPESETQVLRSRSSHVPCSPGTITYRPPSLPARDRDFVRRVDRVEPAALLPANHEAVMPLTSTRSCGQGTARLRGDHTRSEARDSRTSLAVGALALAVVSRRARSASR
jgi:sulfate permease, SulP family